MVYQFIKVYELGFTEVVEEFKAKDLHDAMSKFYRKHNDADYDIMAINGEWV